MNIIHTSKPQYSFNNDFLRYEPGLTNRDTKAFMITKINQSEKIHDKVNSSISILVGVAASVASIAIGVFIIFNSCRLNNGIRIVLGIGLTAGSPISGLISYGVSWLI